MEIRYINSNDDLYDISNIYESSWKYAYKGIIPQTFLDSIPKGRWADRINREGMKNLLLIENGLAIGTSGFCRSRWEKYKDCGEIISIYFLPEYIGKGYGTQLLNRSITELSSLGFDKIILWVLEDNKRARSFYEKNGFVCTGEYLDDNIGGKELREVMYIYNIKKAFPDTEGGNEDE